MKIMCVSKALQSTISKLRMYIWMALCIQNCVFKTALQSPLYVGLHSEGGNSPDPNSADMEEGLMKDSSPRDNSVLSNEGSSPKEIENKTYTRKHPLPDCLIRRLNNW